ncbi:hypothetical protein BDV97DRAFT_373239 [Delphinella strobiligena]|nr:hypothetical protein BDV97DRAFT_373239 [Delphinella strobiligena]
MVSFHFCISPSIPLPSSFLPVGVYTDDSKLSAQHPLRTANLSRTRRKPINDSHGHKAHEKYTTSLQQRQQQAQAYLSSHKDNLYLSPTSSSSGSVPHTLRRTPRFDDRDEGDRRSPRHQRSRSLDSASSAHGPSFNDAASPSPRRRASSTHAHGRAPHPALRISRRTESAILFTLEEAIRTPYPFTPDLVEENAQMSDLGGGGTDNGHGAPRVTGGDVAASKASSSGLRTPRDIMNERHAREARRRAEAERAQAEQASRQAEEEERRRRSTARTSRPVPAAGVADAARSSGDGGGHRRSQSQTSPAVAGAQQYQSMPTTKEGERYGEGGRIGSGSSARVQDDLRASAPGVPTSRYRAGNAPQNAPTSARRAVPSSQPGLRQSSAPTPTPTSSAPPVRESEEAPQQPSGRANTSSFPHAFERWEQLSSHWEGLTSYWLHKLEMNTEEIGRTVPSASALSRQINDLSAAGANLFHAVVELQRLRASSERKFQRWFFETRNEQERGQEDRARLEAALQTERAARADAFARANMAEQDKRNADRMVTEMRRELTISKEEARRAWEELGRKEHEERELTTRLREGAPTTIGGVQVVPTQFSAGASGHGSERRPTASEEMQRRGQRTAPGDDDWLDVADPPSPTDTDPFTESPRARRTSAPIHAQSAGAYQPYPAGSTPASGSTAPTVIPPQHVQGAVSPLQPNIRSTSQTATSSPPDILASTAASRSLHLPTQAPAEAPPELFYHHPGTQTYLHSPHSSISSPQQSQPVQPSAPPPPVPGQQGLREQPSYGSDETEYEFDDHGHLRVDAQNRPIIRHSSDRRGEAGAAETALPPTVTIGRGPTRGAQPAAAEPVGILSEGSESLSGADPADIARERMLATQYGGRPPSPPSPPSMPLQAGSVPPTSAEAMASATAERGGYAEPADYEGSGYENWSSRHHHPTRLSDVLEEDERSRTTWE